MKQELSIGCLTDHHIDSGIGYYSYELTKALNQKAEAVLYKPYRPDHEDVVFHNRDWIRPITYRSFRQYRPYVLPFYLRAGIPMASYDIIHAHWYLAGLASTYFNITPTVVTMHDVSVLHMATANNRYLEYYKWALKRFKSRRIPLITVSEQARKDTILYAEYPEELVFAVHNGLNTERFFPVELDRQDPFTIIYSGGLSEHKNLDLLLQALAIVQDRYPEVALKVAGGSPQKTKYPAMVDELGLRQVTFTGFVPDSDMNHFYNSGNLMVYTSRYEGFGMAPLEAMSCGVPVITTGGGALTEVSGGGAIISEYDDQELAAHIVKMIEDDNHRRATAQRGKDWVKQYTWQHSADETMKIYNTLMK